MFKAPAKRYVSGTLAASLILGGYSSVFAAGKFTKKEEAVVATQTALTKPQQRVDREKKKPDLTASDGLAASIRQFREDEAAGVIQIEMVHDTRIVRIFNTYGPRMALNDGIEATRHETVVRG